MPLSMTSPSAPALSTIALFSGGGGLDLGFASAGFDVRLSTDIDEFGCASMKKNMGKRKAFPSHAVVAQDISKWSVDGLLQASELQKGGVDLVIGGPPCQAFSIFGQRKGLADPRGGLVWEFLRIVRGIRPKGFVFENVYGLTTLNNGDVLRELKRRLSMGGEYKVDVQLYELAAYGIPQWRKRVFIVGSRIGEPPPRMPETHGDGKSLRPFRTVGEVFDGMEAPGVNGLENHRVRAHGDNIIQRYSKMHFGMRDNHTRINRLHPDKPSYTIVVGSDKGGGKGHVHPYEAREVTPRESARLQTFPDWWVFEGNVRHMIRQVGNAVPPLFAAQYASHIRRHMFGDDAPPSPAALRRAIGLNFLA